MAVALAACGCATVPKAFLEAELATHATLGPFVTEQANEGIARINSELPSAGPAEAEALKRKAERLEDHKRTVRLWKWSLEKHKEAAE